MKRDLEAGTSLGSLFYLITINRKTLANPLKRNLEKEKDVLLFHPLSSMDMILEMFGTIVCSNALER